MSVSGFVGPAGTGKTTSLMRELERRLVERPLEGRERVLAVTRMHGSRIRLAERLKKGSAKSRFDCVTFDSLAWHVVNRWRSLLLECGHTLPSDLAYDDVCTAAGMLIHRPEVATWLASKYPFVVVDEFQDCKFGRFDIVSGLAAATEVLVAADEFQNLDSTDEGEAVAWLRAQVTPAELSKVHRTSEHGLLAAAQAIRNGEAPLAGKGFVLLSAPRAAVAACYLANGISWSNGAGVAIISASNPSTSPFVRDAMSRLASKPFIEKRTGKTLGPYPVDWELSQDDLVEHLLGHVRPEHGDSISTDCQLFGEIGVLPGQRDVERWLQHLRRVEGRASCTREELGMAVSRAVQRLRSHHVAQGRWRALTIHQAKNREFDQVLVLWPMNVKADLVLQRKLLYNAITRARHKATVIVQDPKRDRMSRPPFKG